MCLVTSATDAEQAFKGNTDVRLVTSAVLPLVAQLRQTQRFELFSLSTFCHTVWFWWQGWVVGRQVEALCSKARRRTVRTVRRWKGAHTCVRAGKLRYRPDCSTERRRAQERKHAVLQRHLLH